MSDEDVPQLPADTLAILAEFHKEQSERKLKVESIKEREGVDSVDVPEDWQLSQFWYDDTTSEVLAKEALHAVGENGCIALISCPTLYPKVKQMFPESRVTLFEYDTRFSVYGEDYVMYDYKAPLQLPREMAGKFSVVIADPPFLSEECLSKVATTIKFLANDKIILCTGTVMENLADQLLGLKKCAFEPQHKNNLGNEFGCFTNYDFDLYIKPDSS